MARYKSRQQSQVVDPLSGFEILGYIAAGTYGRVYKARETRSHEPSLQEPINNKPSEGRLVAIKKFKSEKGDENNRHTGLSQSAYRELGLCRELDHPNVVGLVTSILHEKSIYLVFDYADHDLLQLIQCHCAANSHNASGGSSSASSNGAKKQTNLSQQLIKDLGKGLASPLIKSIIYQVCAGVAYLHENWVLHRDLKPANIMITMDGRVKVGDLGLARIFREPLQSLYAGDKVVVTVWYRAPELLLGSRHYTPAIDIWAIGCIMAEMLSLRPIFKGEELTGLPDKNGSNFQTDQVDKVTKILGTPTTEQWPLLNATPSYWNLANMRHYKPCFNEWHAHFGRDDPLSLELMKRFFDYNPDTRVSASGAMEYPYFKDPNMQWDKSNCFSHQSAVYPPRRVATSDVNMAEPPKRASSQDTKSKRRRVWTSTQH